MNINDAKTQVKNTVVAYLARDEMGMFRIPSEQQRPIFLIGAPGIGKTAIMSQIADELDIGLVSYSMTHHTRQSALGLPFIVHREYEGGSFDVSEYTMSEIISSIYDYMEKTGLSSGILFLDEINCVSETLYPSMLQFLQFKMFGRHKVPDNWVIVCAGNPVEYNRSVHEFDIVTLDRLRKIEVEPDLEAWKAYARTTNVHPAIRSFLDVKSDKFYSVESTPEGKRFVSARGWSDLSGVMSMYEELDYQIDKRLIVQYVQDDEIAELFSLYYDLFKKYQSDYQVADILAGTAPDEIAVRAREAQFDERLALLSMMIDGISAKTAEVLELANTILSVRDTLREAKPALQDGASVESALGPKIEELERELKRRLASEVSTSQRIRLQRLIISQVQSLIAQCELQHVDGGQRAFDIMQDEYQQAVLGLDPYIDQATKAIDNAFAFIEKVFGDDREMLVFVTELTARSSTSGFISRFGNDSYYAHNDELMVDRNKNSLIGEIEELSGKYRKR